MSQVTDAKLPEKKPGISKTTWFLIGVIALLAVILVGVLLFLKNAPQPERGILPIKEIAIRVGLPDPQHFNKIVRRQLGASPSELRRRHTR